MPASKPTAFADLMRDLTAISMAAAAAIRRARGENRVRIKADGSPVTAADEAAEAIIREGLAQLQPVLPVISEEQAEGEPPAVQGSRYFLVDPLDGTREFIAGRDEYTINIALMADGEPILGIVTAPALSTIWRGVVGLGAERLAIAGGRAAPPQRICVQRRPAAKLRVLVSRSHLDAQTKAYVERLDAAELIGCGSSIKFCRLAEGAADLYPRLAPTHDWDVAAGHAVLAAAGGSVATPDGADLTYGSRQRLIPAFIARGRL